MNYNIKIKNTEPVTVATMRYRGPATGAAKQFPNLFKAVKGNPNRCITEILFPLKEG